MLNRCMKTVTLCIFLAAVPAGGGVAAQEYDPSDWLEPREDVTEPEKAPATPRDRAIEIAELAEADEPNLARYERVFSASLLRRMPVSEIHPVLRRYTNRYGSAEAVFERVVQSEHSAHLEYLLEDGVLVPVALGLTDDDDRLIDSIWIGQAETIDTALQSVFDELRALPGELRLLAAPLGTEGQAEQAEMHGLELGADAETEMPTLAARAQIAEVFAAVSEGRVAWDAVLRPGPTVPAPITLYTATVRAFADPTGPEHSAVSEALSEAGYNDSPAATLRELAAQYRAVVQCEDEAGVFTRAALLSHAEPFPRSAEGRDSAVVVLGGPESGATDDLPDSTERGYLLRTEEGVWFFVGAVWTDPLERPQASRLDRRLDRLLELASLLEPERR